MYVYLHVICLRTPLIFRQPPLSAISNIFILPLNKYVWYSCFIIMSVAACIMLSQLLHPKLHRQLTVFDVITFVWGAICQQGTHLNIPTISGRFVVITIFLAALALFTSYSASIVALLQSPSRFITSIDDLIASPLKIGVHDAGYSRFYILHENDSVIDKVYEKKIKMFGEAAWIYDSFVGIEKLRTQLFGFQVDSASAYKAISRTFTEYEKCSLSELQLIKLPMTTIAVERHSGYKELFTQRFLFLLILVLLVFVNLFFVNFPRIHWQREVGLINREQKRWIPKKTECEDRGRGFVTVGIGEIYPALKMLLIGMILSIFLLICEVVNTKVKKM